MIDSLTQLESASLVVVSLLLFLAAKPMLQGASRATEALIYLFGTSPDPRKRNIITSAEKGEGYQDLVADTVIKETLLPGGLLFAFAYLGGTTEAMHSQDHGTMGWVLALSCAISFGLSRLFSGARRSAALAPIPVAHMMSLAALLGSAICAIAFSIPFESVVASLIVASFSSQLGVLTIRSIRAYGVFAIFWLPAAIFAWLCRVFAAAMAAPVTLPLGLIEAILDSPLRDNRHFRLARAQTNNSAPA